MAATWPTSTKGFSFRQNARDTVLAGDVNDVYYEVMSLEDVLGANPHISTTWSASSYVTPGTFPNTWSSVGARIQNLEHGVSKAVNNSVLITGGSILQPTGSGIVGVVLKGYSAGTGTDLLQAVPYNYSSGTIPTRIDKSGVLYSNGGVVATLTNSETLSNKLFSSSTFDGAANTFSNVPATSVIATGSTNIKTYVDAKPDVFIQSTTPASPTTGDIWVNTGSSVTPFDTSNFIAKTSPSIATAATGNTSFGYRRITASTSSPLSSDGADGDVWLQYIA